MAEGAELGQNGLKMGAKHLFEHAKWSRINFGKMCFGPIFDPFLVPNQPIFKTFWDFPWAKTRDLALKMG